MAEFGDLDDLLADTPSDTSLTTDADEDTATDSAPAKEKPTRSELDELDALLGEARDAQARNKKHKDDLRRVRGSKNSDMDERERRETLARILEWETTRVWRTSCQIQRFNVFTCAKCSRQSIVYDGMWLEQHHDKLKAKRLVRLPGHEELAKAGDMMQFTLATLPVQRVDVVSSVPCCAECSSAPKAGYTPSLKF